LSKSCSRRPARAQGHALAKIDPRLYQSALDNAKAKMAQDEAQLISAQKDLQRSRTLVDKFFETKQVLDQQQAKVDQVIAMVDADRVAIETIPATSYTLRIRRRSSR
jgi:multidrug efflux system membrane fusion protein